MPALRTRYQTVEFDKIDIHIRTLRDKQQYADPEGIAADLCISSALWPIFGTIWPSGIVIAHYLLNYDFQHKHILEVGCGIGLPSLLLNHLSADITATDYHPEVESFLNVNTELNNDSQIPFVLNDWKNTNTTLGQFDLVIGSDLLYEDEHAVLLADFIEKHARKKCTVIIVDPGRKRHGEFSNKMTSYGYSHTKVKPQKTDYLDKPFSGVILEYTR